MFYFLAIILTFIYLVDSESTLANHSLSQRQLTMCLCSALLWPLIAINLINENWAFLINNLQALVGVDFENFQWPWQPGLLEENYEVDLVDQETL